ncbi:hypothetical protein ACO2Q3_25880 [Caulobacter sp. KR2-114]|uniref:hypothetical protein n=1 Tax=Caulobacter sp. KR2-114 TaxID=3400912 RepID=UPI003C0E2838
MSRPLPTLAVLLAAPALALAQPGPPPGGAPSDRPVAHGDHGGAPPESLGPDGQPRPRPRMFISPSGEPFRPVRDGGEPFDVWFARVDANHDGRIDRAEFRADAAAFFKIVDTNGDGAIDGFEINAYEHKIAPELIAETELRAFGPPPRDDDDDQDRGGHGGRRRGGPDGGGGDGRRGRDGAGGGERGPRGHTALINEPEPVAGADLNVDGKVTLAEWMTATDRRFDQLDDRRLGYLTRDALFAKLPKPPVGKRKRGDRGP